MTMMTSGLAELGVWDGAALDGRVAAGLGAAPPAAAAGGDDEDACPQAATSANSALKTTAGERTLIEKLLDAGCIGRGYPRRPGRQHMVPGRGLDGLVPAD